MKNDGKTHALYGGNKVRKLGPLLDLAERRGAERILTAGGAGSHHVLATTLFARQRNLPTAAVLCPQPWTPHAEQVLRCSVAWGVEAIPVSSMATVPGALLEHWRSSDLLVLVGGWGVAGSRGYATAVDELHGQIERGEVPEPDAIVVALGSGGTAAGLLAGIARRRMRTTVVAVSVAIRNAWVARQVVVPLAARLASRSGWPVPIRELNRRLVVDTTRLGAGYGAPTVESEMAMTIGEVEGIHLDHTYTAKAFATALELVGHATTANRTAVTQLEVSLRNTRKQPPLRVLYWHTLAATPLGPLLARGPAGPALPERLRMLLQGG